MEGVLEGEMSGIGTKRGYCQYCDGEGGEYKDMRFLEPFCSLGLVRRHGRSQTLQ